MVAIVAGQGLGLLNTSGSLLGSQGQIGVAAQGGSGERVTVNASTGNLVVQQQDEWLVGRGPDTAVLRTYNSQGGADADNGDQWRLGLSRKVTGLTGSAVNTAGSTVKRIAEDGSETIFTYSATLGAYTSWAGSGSMDTLRYSAGVWTWSDQDSRISETYDHSQGGRLTAVSDPSGNTLTIGYTAGLVSDITDATGQRTQIIYDTAPGKTANIVQVRTVNAEGQQRTRVSYQYDGANRLARVSVDLTPQNTTDSKTYTTDYTYLDPSSRKLASLKQSDGSELQFTYDGNGRIASVKDVRGSDIRTTTFDYSVAGQTSITDAAGRVVRLKYQTAAGQNQYQLTSIDAPGAGSVRQVTIFAYDANGNVASTTDAQGKTTVYGYDSLGHRIYERDSAGNVVQRLYGSASQLLSETRYVQPDPDGSGDAQPSAPLTTRYVYDDKQRLRFVVSPEGRVTEHKYDAFGQKTSELTYAEPMALPAGWSQNFSANADGLTPLPALMQRVPGGLELQGRSGTAAYQSATGLRELPLGSALHAEVTASGPPGSGRSVVIGFTNGLSGAAERRFAVFFRHDTLQAHFYDGSGGATSTGTTPPLGTISATKSYSVDIVVEPNGDAALYVYEKGKDRASGIFYRHSGFGWTSLKTYLQTSYASSASPSSVLISELTETPGYTGAALAAWTAAQGPKALARTDYTYDLRGQLNTRTTYAQLDSAGNGVANGTQATTQYVYDQYGNLLQRIDPRGGATATAGDYVTSYAYDGLNRIVSSTDALNGLTTSVYDDTSRKVTTTAANGLITVTVRDQGGQILSVESRDGTVLGSTTYAYDKLGRQVKTTDPTGRASYTLYDEAGRVAAQIDAEGALTEYRYDRRDQLVQTIAYANKPTATQLSSLAGNPAQSLAAVQPVPSSAQDRVTRRLYNALGQLVKTIDAAGAVTQLTYDGVGRQTGSVQYATLLSSTQLAALAGSGTEIDPGDANATVGSSTDDRRTRQIWSDDGLLVATVDGGGYVHKHEYNAAGQRIATTRYANRTGPSDWSTGTLATLLPVPNSAEDQTTRYLYNKAGQLQGTLDAEGYLTVYEYDLSGNQIEQTRYATRVTNPNGADVAAMQPTGTGLDRTVLRQFDALQRLVREESQPDGLVTTYTYDKVGNLLTATQDAGTAEQRTTQRRYDALGRLTGELGARGAAALAQLGSPPTPAQTEDIWARYGTRHLYDAAGRRIASIASNGVDGAGNKTLYYYDDQGRMTHSINALGEVTEYSYNSFGEQVQQRRYATRLAAAKLSTLSGGLFSAWTNVAADLPKSALDSLQQTGYDMRGLLASRTDALSNTDTFAYNAFGEQRQRIERLNASDTRQTDLLYDRRGNLYASTLDAGTGKLNLASSSVYDAFGRVVQSTDARGNTTKYSFDKLGRLLVTTDSLPQSRKSSYDAFGRVLTQTDALGQTTTYTYDGPTRTLTARSPLGIETTTTWNRYGQTVSITDGRLNTTTYEYDTDGQLKTTLPAAGGATRTAYDNAGRVLRSTDARGTVTEYTYDAANRVLTRTLDGGTGGLNLKTQYEYDALGRTVKVTAPDGTVTLNTFDEESNLKTVTRDQGTGRLNLLTTYTYDAQGNAVTVVEGSGATTKTTQYVYDAAGRRTKEIVDPDGALKLTTTYAYDRNGNVIERVDAAGGKTRYVYDSVGQLRFTIDAVGGASELRYDANGRVVETREYDKAITLPALSDPAAGYTLTELQTRVSGLGARVQSTVYDIDGRAVYAMDALGNVVRRDYDKAGNVVTVVQYGVPISGRPSTVASMQSAVSGQTSSALKRVSYTVYDSANRAVYSIDALKYVTTTAYDGAGLVTRQTRHAQALTTVPSTLNTTTVANALVQQAANDRSTYWAYDAAGRQRFQIDAERFVTETRYDALGRPTHSVRYGARITVPGTVSQATVKALVPAAPGAVDVVVEKRYDAAGRLFEEVDGEQVVTRYVRDALGQVLSKTSASDRAEQIKTAYTYDAAGRMLSETLAPGTSSESATEYTYDAMGRLRTVLQPNGVALLTKDSAWAVDERKRWGITAAAKWIVPNDVTRLRAAYSTEYKYDLEGRLVQQIDQSGTTTFTRNAFGETSAVKDGRGNSSYTVTDALGRARSVIDAEGYLTQYTYDAFGNKTETIRFANKVQGDYTKAATLGIVELSTGQVAPTSGACWIYTDTLATNAKETSGYDKLNRLTTVTDAENATETKVLNAFGDASSVVNKLGGTASFTYDKLGRVLTETLPVQARNTSTGATMNVVNSYQYDARGNRTLSVEAVGLPEQRTTTYLFDKADRQVRKTGMAFTAIDAQGAASTVTPAELTRYDGNGRVIEVVANANVQSGAAVGGARTLRYYDAAGNKIAQIEADGAFTRYTYNPSGQVWREQVYANRVSTLPASAGGTPPTVTAAGGTDRVTVSFYNGQGRMVESRREAVIYWEPPTTPGTAISMALPGSQPATIALGQLLYDASGNVVQETDARGNSIYHYYDKIGRKVLSIDQEGYATAWDYGHLSQAVVKETRYANKVPGTYARQNNTAAASAIRDPSELRATIAHSPDNRITENVVDRLGRVAEKRVKNVASEYVDSAGARSQRVADAVTGYTYDGLGNVTQMRERVAELANGTPVDNVTDTVFDKLGRQIKRIAPGFTDHTNFSVRPITEIQYDGIGNVTREIARGLNDSSEADDRITQFAYNAVGDRIRIIDAELSVTEFSYDASRNVVRKKVLAVRDADDRYRDIETVYAYDAAGRETMQRDVGTGEVRRTDYNAFGEVARKGLGEGWQEYFEYSTLGKVQRSNSGDGVTRIYLYDRAGNATRRISGADVNLRSVALSTVAQDTTLMHTFSVYDKRNQLLRTVEPDITFLRDEYSIKLAFSRQLGDLYGPLGIGSIPGSPYATGAVGQNAPYTAVVGSGSNSTTPAATVSAQGGVQKTGQLSESSLPAPVFTTFSPFDFGWAGDISSPWSRSIVLPAGWPTGLTYRVKDFYGRVTTITDQTRNQPVALSANHWVAEGDNYNIVPTLSASIQVRIGTKWVVLSSITSAVDFSTMVPVGDNFHYRLNVTSVEPEMAIFQLDGVGQWSAESLTPGVSHPQIALLFDEVGSVVQGVYTLKGNPATVRLTARGANNGIAAGVQFYLSKNGPAYSIVAPQTLMKPNIEAFGPTLIFDPLAIGSTTGQFYFRRRGSSDAFSAASFSDSRVFASSFLAPNQSYEFFVRTAARETFGTLWSGDGYVALLESSRLDNVSRSDANLALDFSRAIGEMPAGLAYLIEGSFTTNNNGTSQAVAKWLTGTSASFNIVQELSGLGLGAYQPAALSYNFQLYALRGDGTRQLVGGSSGTASFDGSVAVGAVQGGWTRPVVSLALPANISAQGLVKVRLAGTAESSAVIIPPGDWSRSGSGNLIVLDLSRWFSPAEMREVIVTYSSSDLAVAGSQFGLEARYRIDNRGSTAALSITHTQNQPIINISIAGAARISVLKAGANMQAVDLSQVTRSGSTFSWNASQFLNTSSNRLYYEAVDEANRTVAAGYATFSISASGVLSYNPDPQPVLSPAQASFAAPALAAGFVLAIREEGSSSPFMEYSDLPVVDGKRVLSLVDRRPLAGTKRYEIRYRSINANGVVFSSGSGVLSVSSSGTVTPETREDTLVQFEGPTGADKLRLEITNNSTGIKEIIFLMGRLDSSTNRNVFTWDASRYTPSSGTQIYDYKLVMLKSNDAPYINEVGVSAEIEGQMTLGGQLTTPVQLQQYRTVLVEPAQVDHRLTYNAFGEVSEEFDKDVAKRAAAMVATFGGAVDENAVKTSFSYNTLGKLVRKSDPQTNITAENGFRYRDRPVTSYGYDLLGRLVSTSDANGKVSTQTYVGEGDGKIGRQFSADRSYVTSQYDVFGDARRREDQLRQIVEQTFDKRGRLITVDRLGVTRQGVSVGTLTDRYTYDSFGQRITHTNAILGISKTYFDDLGRIIKTTTAEGRSTTYGYELVPVRDLWPILGVANQNTGGYQRKTVYADGRFVLDNVDYFGLTTWHQDMGGRTYAYNYDWGGRLTSQQSSEGQNIVYAYYANGYLREARDLHENTISRFGYDNAGNRIWEAYNELKDGQPSTLYQSAVITYDELNRISRVKDDLQQLDVQYEYDSVGNRRAVHAYYWDPATQATRREDHMWYTYDEMNRFAITQGQLSGTRGTSKTDTSGRIVVGAEGTLISYDAAGQRRSALDGAGNLEEYFYSEDGFLQNTHLNSKLHSQRRIDKLGRTIEYIEGGKSTSYEYDADSRIRKTSASDGVTTYYYATDTLDTASTASQSGAGSLLRTEFVPSVSGTSLTTSYTYEYWDEAKQSTIKVKASNAASPKWAPGNSRLEYDVNGFVESAYDDEAQLSTNYFTSAHGQVLRRERIQRGQAVGSHYFFYADGRRIGDVGDTPSDNVRLSYAEALATKDKTLDRKTLYKNFKPVTSSDFDQNYEPINESYPAAVGGTYTVRGGETLQTIARAVWGDAAMWYLLADANGLSGTESLVAGQVLIVPNKVTNIHNNSETFRPYNPGEAIGRIDPTLPAPPVKKGCGVVGQIIMVVVAVVATVFTAGVLTAGLGAGFQTIMSAGFSALTGGAVGVAGAGGLLATASGAAAAVGGAVGSIVGQGMGMAMGMQDRFSWGQVGLSALGAGVSAGIGGGSANAWVAAGKAALSSTVSQGLGTALGLQNRFSWAGVAASAAGAGIGHTVGDFVWEKWGEGLGKTGTQIVAGVSGTVAAQLVGTGRVDPRSAFATTLGNALGSSLAAASSGPAYSESAASVSGQSLGAGGPDVISQAYEYMQAHPQSSVPFSEVVDYYGGKAASGYLPSLIPDATRVGFNSRAGEVWSTDANTYPVEQRSIIAGDLPPLAIVGAGGTSTEESFGQYFHGRLGAWGSDINARLDAFAEDPGTSSGLRFAAAMAKNPANWLIGAVQGVGGLATYAADSQFRSQVNAGIGNFLSNDPLGTVGGAATRYWGENSGLEIGRDTFNLVAGGSIGAPLAKLPGLVLGETASLAGTAGGTALRWAQRLDEFSVETVSLNNAGSRYQMGAIGLTVRDLRAEVMQVLPEGFELTRISRGAAILRYGDDTYYSVPKAQYSLIPELRTMDTMGQTFTTRVQSIADGFNPALDLTPEQAFRLNVTRAVPDRGWLADKFESAYKGSYVHGTFGRTLADIDGGSAYRYSTVGPDVVSRTGGTGLKYEITQLTPSLNAIYSHTRKYSDELLRYVTYR